MTFMKKEVNYVKGNGECNFTYITPRNIITTNKNLGKVSNSKTTLYFRSKLIHCKSYNNHL